MTNIDHDALARRIACELNMAAYIEYGEIKDSSSLIANILRESLPTSEDDRQIGHVSVPHHHKELFELQVDLSIKERNEP